MTLRVKQSSSYRGGDWWNWSVWLAGESRELDVIDHVVYTLHPTFAVPVKRVKTRRNGFKLDSSGWGAFKMHIDIVLKSGEVRKRRHWLKLERPQTHDEEDRRPASPVNPIAYVSSGAEDAGIARKLREALAKAGFKVHSLEDSPAGLPEEKAMDQLLGSADVAVFILSGRPSIWTYTEIEHALAHRVPHIIPLVIGSAIELPPRLQDIEALRVDSPEDLPSLAKRILATTRG